jgi:hypothetical protein
MRNIVTFILLIFFHHHLYAESRDALSFRLKASVVKVHVGTKKGGYGVGTGVAISPDLVATNCHVLANSTGVSITKFGNTHTPVALKADWEHDLCILRFQYADLIPVELGDSESLQYEQDIFSIGFPGGPPKPQYTEGKIKALYAFDDSHIIRTDASFVMGASGSPIFDTDGKLVAMSTFKSPGKNAYYYNIPVQWIKTLLGQPDIISTVTEIVPFWDMPEEQRPFFMRVVQLFKNEKWGELHQIAQLWLKSEPNSAEAFYYAGVAEEKMNHLKEAKQYFQQALVIHPEHPAAIIGLRCTEKTAISCNDNF